MGRGGLTPPTAPPPAGRRPAAVRSSDTLIPMLSPPQRGPAVRALGLALPPARMALLHARRPLKRWRYVGVYGPELMLCTAEAFVGPLGQRFWAVAEPGGRLLGGRSLLGSGGVDLAGARLRVRARGRRPDGRRRGAEPVEIDLALAETSAPPAIESVSAAGATGYVWTRKLAGARAAGSVVLDGRRRPVDAEAVVDDTAGYHPRHTVWRWSAGVGVSADGERIGWNLVEGINDDPEGSERTLWVDGEPSEVAPVRFAPDLSAITFAHGAELRFRPWATLAHRTRLGPLRSDYRQPFGTFAGTLVGGRVLAEGYGVMEYHDARW
jgi:hypothetical protein